MFAFWSAYLHLIIQSKITLVIQITLRGYDPIFFSVVHHSNLLHGPFNRYSKENKLLWSNEWVLIGPLATSRQELFGILYRDGENILAVEELNSKITIS